MWQYVAYFSRIVQRMTFLKKKIGKTRGVTKALNHTPSTTVSKEHAVIEVILMCDDHPSHRIYENNSIIIYLQFVFLSNDLSKWDLVICKSFADNFENR